MRVLHETQQPLKRLTGFVETYHYRTSPCQDAPDVRQQQQQQQALHTEVDAGWRPSEHRKNSVLSRLSLVDIWPAGVPNVHMQHAYRIKHALCGAQPE